MISPTVLTIKIVYDKQVVRMDAGDLHGLKDVFVMRDSGECVYHHSYDKAGQQNADGTIISSLLSTVELFSNSVDVGAKMLETANYRFVYHRSKDYIYVARTAQGINPEYISKALDSISSEMTQKLPEKWNGNVDTFKEMDSLIEQQFNKPQLNQFYEITGRATKNLEGIEEKIYAFLRFKGRASLSHIAKLMKIPQEEAIRVTTKLVNDDFLEACS